MNLKDKIALVTGGARGIGKEIALGLARAGAHIALCDINKESLEEAQTEIAALGVRCAIYSIDVSSSKQVNEMVKEVVKEFDTLDILVNNAGITRDGLIMRMKDQDWEDVLNVNLKGAFNCLRAVTRPMMKKRHGKIINISSIVGMDGNAGQANYSASKAGLIGLTKSAAKELGSRGINVNAIAPGFIETPMTDKLSADQKEKIFQAIPLGSIGKPQDIANLVLFLSSDSSSYITGEVIRVDGGISI
jgi:3-oxoacyl-[acyl-carrier protein] reductase